MRRALILLAAADAAAKFALEKKGQKVLIQNGSLQKGHFRELHSYHHIRSI